MRGSIHGQEVFFIEGKWLFIDKAREEFNSQFNHR